MSKKREPTCTQTSDGYVLSNTIMSKRLFCKAVLKAKWNFETRSWLVPLKAATSADDVIKKYKASSYDPGTRAEYLESRRKHEKYLKNQNRPRTEEEQRDRKARFRKMLDNWAEMLQPTPTVVKCGTINGYVTGPDDDHPALADPETGKWMRPRPGVLIFWGNEFTDQLSSL